MLKYKTLFYFKPSITCNYEAYGLVHDFQIRNADMALNNRQSIVESIASNLRVILTPDVPTIIKEAYEKADIPVTYLSAEEVVEITNTFEMGMGREVLNKLRVEKRKEALLASQSIATKVTDTDTQENINNVSDDVSDDSDDGISDDSDDDISDDDEKEEEDDVLECSDCGFTTCECGDDDTDDDEDEDGEDENEEDYDGSDEDDETDEDDEEDDEDDEEDDEDEELSYSELKALTKPELRKIAIKKGISIPLRMGKGDLIRALTEVDGEED